MTTTENLPEVTPKKTVLPAWLRAMRPKQWVKNVLVLAAPLAAGRLFEPAVLLASLWAFISFSLVSASIYPAILVAVGSVVALFLLGYVVPRFSHIYQDIGGDLPWLTRMLMAWGAFVEPRSGLLLGVFAGSVAVLIFWARRPSSRSPC